MDKKKLSKLGLGNKLLLFFMVSVLAAVVWLIVEISKNGFKAAWSDNWGKIVLIIVAEMIIFWIGIIMVYISSKQLGVKWRTIGALTGWIPIVNLIVLGKIISVTGKEYRFEKKKIKLDEKRADKNICRTQYPILMVHGVFFRDFQNFNYWGRVPE